MANCMTCGRSLSLADRIRGRKVCADCERKSAEEKDRALSQLTGLLMTLKDPDARATDAAALGALEAAIGDPRRVRDAKTSVFNHLMDQALSDEILTKDEETRLAVVGSLVFGGDEVGYQQALVPYRSPLLIAMVNGGVLPEITPSPIMLKKGEVLHLVEHAALLKEVIQREFRSGSRGVSFRIMKGVSYRVGASRGQMVEVGRSLVEADEGELCLTSQRAVFTGVRKTVEMQYAKMLDLNVYSDAVQFHVSNRQTPSTFRVSSGPLVAAVINAAAERALA
jgi:hypothetical protein